MYCLCQVQLNYEWDINGCVILVHNQIWQLQYVVCVAVKTQSYMTVYFCNNKY